MKDQFAPKFLFSAGKPFYTNFTDVYELLIPKFQVYDGEITNYYLADTAYNKSV